MLGPLVKMVLKGLVIVGIIIAGIWGYRRMTEENSPETKMKTGIVEKNDVKQRISFSGHTLSLRSSSISPPFDGYVKKLFVKVGSKVKKNEALVSIAETLEMKDSDIFPIRAPFTGTVVQVLVSEGQNVMKSGSGDLSNALLRVDDLTEIFVQAEVPEIDYPSIKAGQDATIKAPAIREREYSGTVIDKALAPVAQDRWSRNTVVFPVKLKVQDPDESLKPGMSVIVDIIVAEKKSVMTLKHEYVENENGEYFVRKLNGERAPVKIGIQDEVNVEILEGLSLGDSIEQVDYLNVH